MSFINTEEPLKVGDHYQYKEGLTGFGDDEILEVELVADRSDDEYWRLDFKPLSKVPEGWELEDGLLKVEMMKGNFYYSGMPRIWDEGEYSY